MKRLVWIAVALVAPAGARAQDCATRYDQCVTEAAPAQRRCMRDFETHAILTCRELEQNPDGSPAADLASCLASHRNGMSTGQEAAEVWARTMVALPAAAGTYEVRATVRTGYVAACEGIVDRYRADCERACRR
jgi:hypothetical protein